ncbi:MAG: glutamate mutase L [Candidatus Ozemobacteraceae bacterium]
MNVKRLDILTIEIGSTITKANGFIRHADGGFEPVAQGFAPTSIGLGDIGIGAGESLLALEEATGYSTDGIETFVNSSAAGGLRMTVHGLTYNMTARAAREASLGAGAIVKMVTAGSLGDSDLDEIREIRPNMLLLAGGVDFGERETVWKNAEKLVSLKLGVPLLYAGNAALRRKVEELAKASGIEFLTAPNVFPDVDVLNVDPLRKLIQEVFSRHIIHAPGMARIALFTSHGVLPTPGAVLRAAELFADVMGDALILDVGGATTDVHSVTEGSREFADKLIDPEPRAKRTVEGDLGVFVNAGNLLEMEEDPAWAARADEIKALPKSERECEMTRRLCQRAVEVGARRHAGVIADIFTPSGRRQVVRGKDLSAVKWVVGTGGALTRIPGGEEILRGICRGPEKHLLPRPDAGILLDRGYLFSALGTIAQVYPDAVRATFLRLFGGNSKNACDRGIFPNSGGIDRVDTPSPGSPQ